MRAIIAALIGSILIVATVSADGSFISPAVTGRASGQDGVSSPRQKAIIIDAGDGTELLILQPTYRGPASEFAWIVPVPGLPAEDGIFPPSPHFIDMAFFVTQPEIFTSIAVQRAQTGLSFAGEAAAEGDPGGNPGAVSVHRRLEAGDYDAALLSATDEYTLQEWLRDEGYAVSHASDEALAHYIGGDWYFVAMKVRPEVAREHQVLTDVPPIAIRFPTDRLTYPLHISRVSAPERTTLSLVVLAEESVGCEQIGWSIPRDGETWMPGWSWGRIRRQLASGDEPSFVCDAVAHVPVSAELETLREGVWAPDRENDPRLVGTRMFTVLAPGDMMDLSFTPAAAPPAHPKLHRRASLRDIFARSPWAVLIAVALFALVVWRTGHLWPNEAVRLAAVIGVPLVVWGVAPPTLVIYLLALPILLIMTERLGRSTDGDSMEWMTSGGKATAAGVLFLVSLPAGVVAAWLFDWPLPLLLMTAGVFVLGGTVLALLQIRDESVHAPASEDAPPEAAPRPSRRELALGAFVAAGWAAVLIAAGTAEPAPAITAGDGMLAHAYFALVSIIPAPVVVFAVEIAWMAATWVFLGRHLRDWSKRAHGYFLQLTVAICILYGATIPLGLSNPGIIGSPWARELGAATVLHLPALILGIALLCFTVLAPFTTARSKRVSQGFATVAALMGLLVFAGSVQFTSEAEAGAASREARTVIGKTSMALARLDEGLTRFADETGAFPMRLEDLTSRTPPAEGLDGSGNRVQIDASAEGPWLVAVPIDPLTGRRDTWVYEPTGDPMVASGAYVIEVEQVTRPREQPNALGYWALARMGAGGRATSQIIDIPERIRQGVGIGSDPEVR